MTNILVTGANGFIGEALCKEAAARGFKVRGSTRVACLLEGAENIVVGTLDGSTDWRAALSSVDVVIHLAARVHIMRDSVADPRAEFLRTNLHGTANLARQAAQAGVKRFIYVSSIKVNGEQTEGMQAFTETDEPHPQEPYAVSKWQSEQVLRQIAQETGLEMVILRPPLVHGPGVKANFQTLMQAVEKGIPLPFANVDNARSLLYLGNLVDALLLCATHPAAKGRTYLLSDGEEISMPDLARVLGQGMGKQARLFPFPSGLLRLLAVIAGRRGAYDRVTGSLRIDSAPIRKELGWQPRYTLREGLLETAARYGEQHRTSTEPALPRLPASAQSCRVSIIIVNYNAGDVLRTCVGRAVTQAEQVIVVDNDSSDDSVAALKNEFPSVTIIANERNLGFARACNQGAMAARGRYLLFLNPDCILEADAVSALVSAVQSSPDVGMVGGMLTNPDGSEQGGSRRAVPTPWRSLVRVSGLGGLSGRYPRLFSDFALHKQPLPEKPIEVEAISGACMLARRDVLEKVGLLDEGYFMHCEDLDWCMRFRRAGWKLLFVPDARMVHHKGYCSKDRPFFVEWNKHKGMLRFYNKFFRHQYPGLLMGLVTVGVWARFAGLAGRHCMNRLLRRRPRGG